MITRKKPQEANLAARLAFIVETRLWHKQQAEAMSESNPSQAKLHHVAVVHLTKVAQKLQARMLLEKAQVTIWKN